MVCPTLIYTSGNSLNGLGVWDGGTKCTMLQTNGFIVTRDWPSGTFLYSVLLSSTIPNYAARVINCAVTDDGFLFIYVRRSTPNPGFMSLFKHDIAAQTSTVHHAPVTDNNRLTGPSWNPYDGMLYEFWSPNSSGDTYRLLRWDPAVPGPYTEVWTTPGWEFGGSDMVTFTADGGMWFALEDPVLLDDAHPRRLDLDTLTVTSYTGVVDSEAGIPNGASSVLSSGVDQGWELRSDGSVVDTDCVLFDTPGTARVHCTDTRSTFIYPTSGGAGTAIYELLLPEDVPPPVIDYGPSSVRSYKYW